MKPLVSCLMPTKDRPEFVPRAIAQFLAQDYPGRELVIIEDGAPLLIDLIPLNLFTGANPSIRHHRFSGSLGTKLNYGVSQARGTVCMHWDDDDWYSPDRISIQIAHMQMAARAVAGMSSMVFYRENESAGYEYTAAAGYALGTSLCYRRDWALQHPHADMTAGEDQAFCMEAHAHSELSTISGLRCIVARDHDANSAPRRWHEPEWREMMLASDNWREIPLERFSATVAGPLRHCAA